MADEFDAFLCFAGADMAIARVLVEALETMAQREGRLLRLFVSYREAPEV